MRAPSSAVYKSLKGSPGCDSGDAVRQNDVAVCTLQKGGGHLANRSFNEQFVLRKFACRSGDSGMKIFTYALLFDFKRNEQLHLLNNTACSKSAKRE